MYLRGVRGEEAPHAPPRLECQRERARRRGSEQGSMRSDEAEEGCKRRRVLRLFERWGFTGVPRS